MLNYKIFSWINASGLSLLSGLGLATQAAAGIVTTGGGVLYDEQANPWFLENTEEVTYCLDIDQEHMHISPTLIETRVRQAFTTWQAALRAADKQTDPSAQLKPYGQVRLGTQRFIQETCREETQLRFQFGRLTDGQRLLLSHPDRFVATTVRTEYDEVNLVGKGFIYVAPASGPLRPSAARFAPDPWEACGGCILERTLLHELGHVFGFTHQGNAGDLMGSRTLEYLTRKDIVDGLSTPEIAEIFAAEMNQVDLFAFPSRFVYDECPKDSAGAAEGPFSRFFHAPVAWACVRLVITTASHTVDVYGAKDFQTPWQLLGTATSSHGEYSRSGKDSDILVELTDKQQVFTQLPADVKVQGFLLGPNAFAEELASLNYRSVDGSYHAPLLLSLRPNARFALFGSLDGSITEVVNN